MSEMLFTYQDQVHASLRVRIDEGGNVHIMHKNPDDSWEGHGYAAGVWESICNIATKGQRIYHAAKAEQEVE
jgi:hypothetical protein